MSRKCYPYIRWSTSRQEDGNSLERQTEKVQRFCQQHGLTAEPDIIDSGVSSFRGRNLHSGELGKFLAKARNGEISPGSVLLIENVDRLTRMKLANGLQLFTDIINTGVCIGVADSLELFSRENMLLGGFIKIIVELERANLESSRKRDMGKAAWGSKINKMKSGVMATKKGPEWLVADNGQWRILEEKAAPIRRLFELALLTGVGDATKRVNGEYGTSWKIYQAQYLLKNRKLVGEHVPRITQEDGTKTKGEAVPDYYPVVVDAVLFARVAEQISQRRPFKEGGGGKVDGKKLNFLRGLIICSFCGSTVRYMKKSGKEYLMCTASMTGECRLKGTQSVRAEGIRRKFLNLEQHTAVREFMAANAAAVATLERERLELTQKLAPLLIREHQLRERLTGGVEDDLDVLGDALRGVMRKHKALELQITGIQQRKEEAAAIAGATLPHDRIEWLVSDDSPEAIVERGRLNIHLRQLFKHVKINWRERVLWFRPRESVGFRPDFYLAF